MKGSPCGIGGAAYLPENLHDIDGRSVLICPGCSKHLAPTKNGRIRQHTQPSTPGGEHPVMEGILDASLTEAKLWLRNRLEDGAECPCCRQLAKVYRRRINSGMAVALIKLYRAGGTDWVHKPTVLAGVGAAARDESLLRYWGLLQEHDDKRPDGGRAGWWRVTELGARFVRGEVLVPAWVHLYDSRPVHLPGMRTFAEEQVSIQTCLGKRFDWAELMGRPF